MEQQEKVRSAQKMLVLHGYSKAYPMSGIRKVIGKGPAILRSYLRHRGNVRLWERLSSRCRNEQKKIDLLRSGLSVLSLTMFVTTEDHKREKKLFRRVSYRPSQRGATTGGLSLWTSRNSILNGQVPKSIRKAWSWTTLSCSLSDTPGRFKIRQ